MNKLTFLLLSLLSVFAFQACSDDSDEVEPGQNSDVTVTTPQVTATTATSLTVSSSVNGNPDNVAMKGFCYSVNNQTPTIKDNVVEADGNFSATISGLVSNTVYYIRAYVYGNSRYTYSETITSATAGQAIDEQLKNYVAPAYEDNYVDIADWTNRSRWNLSNVHDPTVVLAEDGYYYMYQTDASYGNAHTAGGHFHARRSKDLVNWEYMGGTMQSLPEWVIPKLNEIRKEMGLAEVNPDVNDFGYWAPCVRKVRNGLYRMYYSIVCPGYIDGDGTWSERAFIGLMENTDPSNNSGWEDKGYVITNASDRGLNFRVKPDNWAACYFLWNAIDPTYVITSEGEHWLAYGSWHSGIVALQVDAETGKPQAELPLPWGTADEVAPYGRLLATRQMGNRWQASEGAEIVYNAATGYYYMFVAYDALDVPYNTRVCRSRSFEGPYMGIDGTDLTNVGGDMYPVVTHPYKFKQGYGWVGFSHCAIFDDGQGNWYYASQARFPANANNNPYSNALMMGHVRSLRWTTDGWPVVMPERYGAVPQVEIDESELAGSWENIDLSYDYGKQKTAETMTLSADHKVSGGSFDGQTWSYDAAKQILKIGNAELCIQRETDWEANPRTHTIVYAGYAGTKTYWGKKSK